MFIKSCPASNPPLPFVPFPTLSYAPSPACYCEGPECASGATGMRQSGRQNQNHGWQNWGPSGTGADRPAPTPACSPPSAGASITLTAASDIPANSFVTFVSGLAVTSVRGTITGRSVSAVIPSTASGQTYVFVSKTNQTGTLDGASVLFGPAIVEVNPPPVMLN